MKRLLTLFLGLTLAMATLVAAVPQDPAAAVPRISISDLDKALKSGNVVVVDVRSLDAYKMGHLPGAILIPFGEVQNRAKELPKDKLIVAYCS